MTLGLSVPTPDFPVVGNSLPIAILFLLHIAIAEYSLGAITLGVAFEWWGERCDDARARQLGRTLGHSYYLVFSLGATVAVFAVTALIGLWGNLVGTLFNRFLPLIGVAFGSFLLIAPLLVIYQTQAGKMAPRRHLAVGVALCVLQTLFMVGIVELDAFLITPGNTGIFSAMLNPVYWPLLLHRLVGNVSWAALFVAGVMALRIRSARNEDESTYRSWATWVLLRIGTWSLLVMIPLGALLVGVLRVSQLGFHDNLVHGSGAALFYVQLALLGIVVTGINFALSRERPDGEPDRRNPLLIGVLGMVVAVLPVEILGSDTYLIRYAGLAAAVVATALHLAQRRERRGTARSVAAPGDAITFPYMGERARLARVAVATAGVFAAVLALWMGYMKEHAHGTYAVYGEMTLQDAHGQYNPAQVYP